MVGGSGGGCGSSEQPEMSGIAKSTAAVCDGGGNSSSMVDVVNGGQVVRDGGGGNSSSMVDVVNGGQVVRDGCDQGATGLPEMEPRSGARKGEKQLVQHGDAAVAPVASTSFKRSGGTGSSGGRRAVQKRVVTVPISDIGEGSRARSNGSSVGAAGGDAAPPPSDSWTWRKYGQKPIKGSPYPRGYYRCSSSKGCPARKQVERSRADPSMLMVTYASEHNHPWPTPRISSHHASRQSVAAAQAAGAGTPPPQQMVAAGKPIPPPPLVSSSSTDEEDMEVEYENAAVEEEEEEVEVKVKEKILAELEFKIGKTGGNTITTTTTTTMTTTTTVASTATTSTAPTVTTSSPTSEETETFSTEHSALSGGGSGSDVDSTTLIPPLAPEGVVVVDDDDLCSTWFPSISLCSTTADTAGTMLPFSYDELLADLGGRSGGGGGYGVDEDEESMFAGLGELPEFSLVFRRGILPEHAADFRR